MIREASRKGLSQHFGGIDVYGLDLKMDTPKPHPKNASGDFYVQDGCCLACMAPHAIAPELMGFDDSEQHCFVKLQPRSDAELFQAIRMVRSADLQCIRYCGRDSEIVRRLAEIGEADACDFPSSAEPILRNHVTFVSAIADEAQGIGIALRDYVVNQFSQRASAGVKPLSVEGDTVSFSYCWYEEKYYTVWVERGEPSTNRWLVRHSPTWEVGSIAVTLEIDDWLRSDSGFSEFRWYTEEYWKRLDQWQLRPY